MAPAVRSGARAKAMEAAFHISVQAALISVGRPWPPCSGGAGKAFHPASVQAR